MFVSSANYRSTRFSHDPYVGVTCTWKRERFVSVLLLTEATLTDVPEQKATLPAAEVA